MKFKKKNKEVLLIIGKSLWRQWATTDVTDLLHDNNPKTTGAPSEDLLNYLHCIFSQTKRLIKKIFSGFLIDIKIYRISIFQRKRKCVI